MDDATDFDYWLLEYYGSGDDIVPFGVLVFSDDREVVFVRIRRNWDELGDADAAEILSGYEELIADMISERGVAGMMTVFADTLSNSIRIREGQIRSANAREAMQELYARHVKQRRC